MSLAALCIILAILAAIGYASERAFTRHAERAAARNADLEQLINGGELRRHLTAEAERLFPGTDSDRFDGNQVMSGNACDHEMTSDNRFDGDCLDPPCDQEYGRVCGWHLYQVRRDMPGRHRLGNTPLDDQPGHVITEVANRMQRRQP